MGILIFLAVIVLVVAIHEMGHYLACRALGVPVTEFAIGMGPRLFGIHTQRTKWNVRALPIGGFISMDNEVLETLAPWRKIVIALAGPFANLAPFILIMIYLKGVWATTKLFALFYWETAKVFGNLFVSPFKWIASFFYTAPTVVTGVAEKINDTAIGPIGMGQMTSRMTEASGAGNAFMVMFMLLSIGLAFTNLMPIPPLDGGRVLAAGVEQVAGRDTARRVNNIVMLLGVVALLVFIVLVTVKDVIRLF